MLLFKNIAELAKSPARGLSTQPLAPEFAKRQVPLWRLKSATPGIPVLSAFGTRLTLGTNPANQEESYSSGSGIGNLRPLLSNLTFWENRGAQVGSTGNLTHFAPFCTSRDQCLQIVLLFKIIAELAKSPARGLSTQALASEFAKR